MEVPKATSGTKSGIRMFLDECDQGKYHGTIQYSTLRNGDSLFSLKNHPTVCAELLQHKAPYFIIWLS